MKNPSKPLALLALIGLSGTVLAQNGNGNSQAGGLPALAEQIANLQSLVFELQAQVDEMGGASDPYVGNYMAFQFENNQYGCGTTLAPPAGQLLSYLQNQGISSTSAFAGVHSATADGDTLTFSGADIVRNELRLSGKFETSAFSEGPFSAAIGEDGSLSIEADNEADNFIVGQMADDGSSFVILTQGAEPDNNGTCTDAWTILNIGVRI